MTTSTVRLTFPSQADYLILARLAIVGIGRVMQLDETVLADLKLAVTEACANVVRHAYDGGAGEVRITYELGSDSLSVTVEDDGGGFDPSILDNAVPLEETVTEGMGIPLIRAIADELSVETRPVGGTTVRFTKSTAQATLAS